MALNANAIVTLAEAKNQLNLQDSSADSTVESWINDVSNAVEEYTGRKFVVSSISGEILDGDGSNRLYPRYFPITQLSTETSPSTAQKLASLQYRATPDGTWTDIETNINHVFLDSTKPYIELYDEVFPYGRQNVKISYKAGFSTVPSEVRKLVLEMVHIWYAESKFGNDSLGRSQTSINAMGGNMNVAWLDMQPRWKKVLERYRIVSME